MVQVTQPYRKTLSGSIGAGMKSVFGGNSRTYYMLVHKVSSKYHRAGESQPIIVDEVEIGRGSQCQVRFDDTFATVSRRHAAIVKDGDNWKLVQLSTTNSTYLNGRKVDKEWYLQNGDEIQLSTNGPKLGFIVPEGEKGRVSSIGLTARLNLFRKQALRPYKTALSVMAAVLVLGILGGILKFVDVQGELVKKNQEIAQLIINNQNDSIALDTLGKQLMETSMALVESKNDNKKMKEEFKRKENARQSELNKLRVELDDLKKQVDIEDEVIEKLQRAQKDVYFMSCDVYFDDLLCTGWSGTGFLLDDGRFVTARHCVDILEFKPAFEKIKLDTPEGEVIVRKIADEHIAGVFAMNKAYDSPERVTHKFKAIAPYSANDIFMNNAPVFHKGHAEVVVDKGPYLMCVENENIMTSIAWAKRPDNQDFAWVQTNKRGGIKADAEFARNMPVGTKLWVYGYPQGEGKGTKPRLSESSVAVAGLNEKGCIQLSNEETDGGNSGGPVFAIHNGELVVVGILSGSSPLGGRGMMKDRVVPISAIGK